MTAGWLWKRGDVVILKSGGPLMTVMKWEEYEPPIEPFLGLGMTQHFSWGALCCWFDERGVYQDRWFEPDLLRRYTPAGEA